MSDEELVSIIINGNTEHYGELVVRYNSPLVRYVTYLLHDRGLAEDIVQDTFIKAYRNLRGYNRRYKFSSWLYRIAHNTAMDAVKKNHAVPTEDSALGQLTAIEPKVAEQIDRQILARDINHCLERLHYKYREPLVLHYLQHKSYREVSDILRLPTATIGVHINRAKSRLRTICKELGVTT